METALTGSKRVGLAIAVQKKYFCSKLPDR
jgi:hypothetical protein